ncbi:MAG: hypothetical protein WEB52_04700 [Dehalococcoidia bacterium]
MSESQWRTVRSFHAERLGGAGAGHSYFAVPAVLFLSHDDDETWAREIVIWIADSESGTEHESLLGRDILEHFRLTFVQPTELTLDPR